MTITDNDIGIEIPKRLYPIYERINRLSFGILDIILNSINRFSVERGPEGAASTAFFTAFAIFPLLIVIVAIGSYFIDSEMLKSQLIQIVEFAIPVHRDIVFTNIERVFNQREAVGIVALLSLAWSATGMFTSFIRNINRAWPKAKIRGFLHGRAMGFLLIGALFGLLVIASVTTTFISILSNYSVPILGFDIRSIIPSWSTLTHSIPIILEMVIFMILYYWLPNVKVRWLAALFAALTATIAWQISNRGFAWYLASGFNNFSLIYGSLGTIVVLMLWIYLNYLIIYFCAHLSAAIDYYLDKRDAKKITSELSTFS
jgi:membrane protein